MFVIFVRIMYKQGLNFFRCTFLVLWQKWKVGLCRKQQTVQREEDNTKPPMVHHLLLKKPCDVRSSLSSSCRFFHIIHDNFKIKVGTIDNSKIKILSFWHRCWYWDYWLCQMQVKLLKKKGGGSSVYCFFNFHFWWYIIETQ